MCDDREPLSGTFVHGARTEFIRHEGYVNFGTQNVLRMEFGIVKKFTDAKGAARSILGLSLKYLPGYPAPFLDQLLTKGAIKHKEFSMYFDPEHMNRGELLLGGGDSAKYHGELVALPLADENGWIVKLNSIKITGMSLLEESYPIIIDSGTDFLIVPEKVSDAITAHIRDSARAVGAEVESSNNGLLRILGCKGRANLPNIELTFEGLRGKNNFNLVLSQEVYLNELSDGHCVLLITAIPGNRKLIMALTFLRSYYINFNKEKHQIRIAKTIKRSQKGAPPPTLRTCCNIGIYLKPAIKRNTFRSPCLTIQILIYNCDMIPHTQSYHTMIKCATKNIAD
ncbi:hypothetical protein FOL47_002214 [Perkinsus chesapeaki]|uniref:Peptidase A1 domain-containing protein n=1 Tax=Perkinsus chesapeaki TaxID=330153 RepID=A0A7J6MFA4_PERCH|nr:hypothetical protein FOL47_002214 [Perkinsus chesapeaki]